MYCSKLFLLCVSLLCTSSSLFSMAVGKGEPSFSGSFEDFFGMKQIVVNSSRWLYPVELTEREKEYYLVHQLPLNHPWMEDVQATVAKRKGGQVLQSNEKKLWIKNYALGRISSRLMIDSVISRFNFKQIKFPKEYIFFTDDQNRVVFVKSAEELAKKIKTKELDCNVVQEDIPYNQNAKLNAVQAEELNVLLRFVYLDVGSAGAPNIYILPDGAYIIDAEDKGEHFITNWKKLWSRYSYDEQAKKVIEQKRRELQNYIEQCVRYTAQKKGIALPKDSKNFPDSLLPVFEHEPERRGLSSVEGAFLSRLFNNEEEEKQFFASFKE